MKIKLSELVDMFDEIPYFEHIVYDKKEDSFIFIDLNMMTMSKYEEVIDEIEQDEGGRYYFLPNKYIFHDSEIIEEYIDEVDNEMIQEELEESFFGKEKYRRFKDTLKKYRLENDYYNYREKYLRNMAIEWCEKNKIEYEK